MVIKRGYVSRHKTQGGTKRVEIICDICEQPIIGEKMRLIIGDEEKILGVCTKCWEKEQEIE